MREQVVAAPRDAGDDSVADDGESEDLAEAELGAGVLRQVRDALQRIEDGTYGCCLVDGEPIELAGSTRRRGLRTVAGTRSSWRRPLDPSRRCDADDP